MVGRITLHYWTNRVALWHLVGVYLPLFKSEHDRQRELRLRLVDERETAYWDGTAWEVQLPDRCVVCAQPTDLDEVQEIHAVPRLTWALLAPPIGLLLGGALALVFWNPWPVPLGLLAGLVTGGCQRSTVEVRLRLRRCPKHATVSHLPELLATANGLVIRVGRKAVLHSEARPKRRKPPSEPRPSAVEAAPDIPAQLDATRTDPIETRVSLVDSSPQVIAENNHEQIPAPVEEAPATVPDLPTSLEQEQVTDLILVDAPDDKLEAPIPLVDWPGLPCPEPVQKAEPFDDKPIPVDADFLLEEPPHSAEQEKPPTSSD
jgi:hypothetical protein